ncbi:hypothetical protein [Synechococcus sp. PCC 6312]|uniref:hypothetical protein n=1 Tax=Synechococcus sp. (strain ATCC 27167 / PCC 6312) TaxID=195253 RepID=UPI0002E07CC2|nr:hypothetical protein [Synechococcus sp. PCC 6312]
MLRISWPGLVGIATFTLAGALSTTVPVQANPGPKPLLAISKPTTGMPNLKNGIYLYGESSRPGQLRQTYMVFEVNNNGITGAVYMPHSSYDCFQGTVQAGTINALMLDSFEASSYPVTVNLGELHPLQASAADQTLLKSCQASLAPQFQAATEPNLAQAIPHLQP